MHRDATRELQRGRIALVACFALACQTWSPAQLPSATSSTLTPTPAVASGPPRYGIGEPATAAEIAAWDIDVMPDGEGLPEGQGTAEQGEAIYAVKCAHCHGANGEGGPFDALVGRVEGDGFPFAVEPGLKKTVGNYWPWATTLFDYTRRAMPLERPGSLSNDEVYALTAYVLYLNGLLRQDAVLDRASLPTIVMPARGRFFEDDRRGGPEIR